MAGKWDSNFKHLVEANPGHFIEWLLPGAHYVRELNTHLNRGIDIDILYEVIFQRIRILVHLEFQRYEDADIDKRVLEYNVFASCKKASLLAITFTLASLALSRPESLE